MLFRIKTAKHKKNIYYIEIYMYSLKGKTKKINRMLHLLTISDMPTYHILDDCEK